MVHQPILNPLIQHFFGSIIKYNRGDYSSLHSWLMDDKLTTFRKDFNGRFVPAFTNHSFHFDGVEVGKFFKEWCTKRGVNHIDSEVLDVSFDEREYLQSVKLANGETIESNFWFDCSGFSRVLMGKTKNKWKSFKDYLPTNTAIPFSTEVSSKNVKFETLAHALNAGWMWKIPLQHRNGCGYVFCDQFINEDKAVDEVQKILGHKIDPIKTIKFEAGRYEKVWYNNIAALGLSSHFLEPLQATSIHITIISLANLIFHYLKGEILYFEDMDKYNGMVNNMIDDYADLLQMHYLAGRQDTPFWKYICNSFNTSFGISDNLSFGIKYIKLSPSHFGNTFSPILISLMAITPTPLIDDTPNFVFILYLRCVITFSVISITLFFYPKAIS